MFCKYIYWSISDELWFVIVSNHSLIIIDRVNLTSETTTVGFLSPYFLQTSYHFQVKKIESLLKIIFDISFFFSFQEYFAKKEFAKINLLSFWIWLNNVYAEEDYIIWPKWWKNWHCNEFTWLNTLYIW